MNVESIIKELECTICLNTFSVPCVLKCGHTFCRQCINEYSSQAKAQKCPLCKASYQRRQLSVNIVVENILQGLRLQPQSCETTKRSSAASDFFVCTSNLPAYIKEKFDRFCHIFRVKVGSNVDSKVTHLIAGPNQQDPTVCRRTSKYLHALIRGVWILSIDWIVESLRHEELQPEAPYLIKADDNFQNAPQISRLFGGHHELLLRFSFYVDDSDSSSSMVAQDVKEMIKLCGGTVVKAAYQQTTIVLKVVDNPRKNTVWRAVNPLKLNQKWLYDSISKGSMQSFFDYLVD